MPISVLGGATADRKPSRRLRPAPQTHSAAWRSSQGNTFRATIGKVKDLEATTVAVDAQAVRDITQFCNGGVDGDAKAWCDKTLKVLTTTPEQARAAMVARAKDELTGVRFGALAGEKARA